MIFSIQFTIRDNTGSGYSDHGAGGGSGYLTYTSQAVTPGLARFLIRKLVIYYMLQNVFIFDLLIWKICFFKESS